MANFGLDWSLMSEAAEVFRKSTKITKNVWIRSIFDQMDKFFH